MYKKKIAEIGAEADAIQFTYIKGEKKYNPLKEGSVEYTRFKELIELIHSLEEKQRIFDQSENKIAVKDYIILDHKSYTRIAGVPAKMAKSLPVGYGFVVLDDSQNDSPTMKEMIELAEIYNGTLEGYVIPTSDEDRDDARITFETLILPISAKVAAKLNKKLKPDKFSLEDDGSYRLWWD